MDWQTWSNIIIALFGAGGLTTVVVKWLDGRSKGAPLTEQKAREIEATAAAEDVGLVQEWKRYADELREQNNLVWDQNRSLWTQNQELADQNVLLRNASATERERTAMAINYVNELRSHINRELPPPPPPWPDGLTNR